MNDYVTAQERMDLDIQECTGCGRTSDEIIKEDDCTEDELEWSSKTTNSGLWYCHTDCYRDSH